MGGKLKAVSLLVVMYVLGVASGVVYQHCTSNRWDRYAHGSRRLEKLKNELKLTPEQEKAVGDIFNKAHDRARQVNEEVAWDLDDIHKESVQSIRKILTPDQQQRFDQLHERFHFRHRTPHADSKP